MLVEDRDGEMELTREGYYVGGRKARWGKGCRLKGEEEEGEV